VLGLGWDGTLSRADGAILFSGIVIYTVASIVQGRRVMARERAEEAASLEAEGLPSKPATGAGQVLLQFVLIAVGLAILVVGADQLVQAARSFAMALGVSELVIGLTVVAVGTSLPEAATSIIAGMRGEREIALGNAVGSNIFNILAVLGIAGLLTPGGVPVSAQALRFDIPVMIGVAVVCLPVVFTGARIARWEGALFLAYYAIYTGFLYLRSEEHELIEEFSALMIAFVLPITALGLVLTVLWALRSRRAARGSGGEG
jgi:cation:H+ antiporter